MDLAELEVVEDVLTRLRDLGCTLSVDDFGTGASSMSGASSDFSSHRNAKLAIFDYLESFYNRRRRHTSIAMRTPEAHEQLSTTLENEAVATLENEATPTDWLGDLGGGLGVDSAACR